MTKSLNRFPDSFSYLNALSERPKITTQGDIAQAKSFLCVLIGKQKYYLQLNWIKAVIPNPVVTPVGHTQPWFEGILKAQNEIYSVIHIEQTLDLPLTKAGKNYAITLAKLEGNYAVLVSDVLGISKTQKLKPIESHGFTITYEASDQQQTITELSIDSLIEAPFFSNFSIF